MKKKKLSDKQKQIMQSVLTKGGPEALLEGDVVCHRGKEYVVRDADGAIYNVLSNKRFSPVVGDRVMFRVTEESESSVVQILPRKNELARFDRYGRNPIAANIDYACVVLAAKPEPWPEMISQYVTYLSILKIKPCFIVNKTDIGEPLEAIGLRLRFIQEHLDIPVFWGSSRDPDFIHTLRKFLSGQRAIFIGPSGVGKSSLIQKIFPSELLKIGGLSDAEKGCHTTSVTQLYEGVDKTAIIDAPGIRQCVLGVIKRDELKKGFADFQAQGCKFKDCDHIHSAGCVIIKKAESDEGWRQRYSDYIFLGQKFIDIAF